jgi:hypothetical protein
MSLLPQHKKSPEELAKLRESLGIPGQPPLGDPSAARPALPQESSGLASQEDLREIPAVAVEAKPDAAGLKGPDAAPLAPLPAPELPVRKKRSLRRADRHPLAAAEHEASSVPAPLGSTAPASPRIVHSLRKSEQAPLTQSKSPPPDSSLPIHRHSPEEIREIRRQEVLAMQKVAVEQVSHKAHWVIVIPGYLFALAAVIGCYHYHLEISVTASCLAISFLVAGFLLIWKPFSRHHGAFIGVMSLLIAVFGVLYYFPQLRYGT